MKKNKKFFELPAILLLPTDFCEVLTTSGGSTEQTINKSDATLAYGEGDGETL